MSCMQDCHGKSLLSIKMQPMSSQDSLLDMYTIMLRKSYHRDVGMALGPLSDQ